MWRLVSEEQVEDGISGHGERLVLNDGIGQTSELEVTKLYKL